jgi:hypothetical protein
MSAVEIGRVFDYRVAVERGDDPVQQIVATLGVRYFSSPEDNSYFYAVLLIEELSNMVYFEFYIVGFDFRTDFYLFDEAAGLRFTCFPLTLTLFVKVFTEIHYAANGRLSLGRDFDQIETLLFGLGQRFLGGDYADLLSLVVY